MSLQNWGEEVDFLARPVELGDGYRAIVARDYADLVARAELVFSTLFRAMIATLILGVTGGFFSAASTLRRVERLNRELSTVVRDDPGKRLDASSEKGYVRQLALVMNAMLDQMESLMQGVRSVSDNIAHDLRTPLTRMRNKLSQLREGLESSQQGQDVDRIIEDCDDLLASFNALLRISTLESGSRLAGGGEVDLQALLRDVVEFYEPLAQQRGIALRLDAPGPVNCRGEADLLFQMFTNLLDNAVKYTPQQGEISVSLLGGAGSEAGHTVVIADSGPGIPVQEHKNVFRRFYRVESSRSEQPGHGLGLSLAQAIAHYHGGSLELATNNPGLMVRVNLS
jgi:signal transduction histidine kinase